MKIQTYFYLLPLLLLLACSKSEQQAITEHPSDLTDKALEAHGLVKSSKFDIDFDFRDKHYRALVDGGHYDYYRQFSDTTGAEVVDHLYNEGFVRTIDGDSIALNPDKAHAYSESINSVIYFALLPYFLKDPAAQHKELGKVTIKGQEYHKVKVTFEQEGGGTDHDDIFIYWFRTYNYALDYLAYSYLREGGGVRFREAYNTRRVDGVYFADYINYKHQDPKFPAEKTDKAFEQGELEELSRIDLENIEVKRGLRQ